MPVRRAVKALAPVLALLAQPAAAQAYQCRAPSAAPSVPAISRDGPVRQRPVARYTLALSWSPEFCRSRENSAHNAFQCSGSGGRFGFVVHGLWPEARGSDFPQWCPTRRSPSPALVRQHLCMTPDAALLAHEWARHGACMVPRPETYFGVARTLWNALRWPDYDRLSRQQGLTAGEVRQAFVDANPGYRADAVGLVLTDRGWLREMRLCLGRNFRAVACPRGQFGPADSTNVRIWRGL